jgi:hypothetical protein
LVTLGRAGYTKPAGDTPLEFAEALSASGCGAAELVVRFTRCYYDARYGNGEQGEVRAREMTELLGQVRQHLSRGDSRASEADATNGKRGTQSNRGTRSNRGSTSSAADGPEEAERR